VFFGQKDHAHAVLTRRRQATALRRQLGAVQGVGQLQQNAGAVAHELVGAHGTAVVEVGQYLQALLHHGVAFLPLDVGHKAHATGVVLVRRVVQAVLAQLVDFKAKRHGKLLSG